MRLFIGVCFVFVTACSSKKTEDTPNPMTTGAAAPTTAAPPGALTCDRVLSKELRAKYFASATIKSIPQPIAQAAECKVAMGDDEVTIAVTCHDNMAASMAMSIESLKKNLHAKDLLGVGRGAVTVDMGANVHVTAWDTDSNCSISAGVPTAIDPASFANDLLASLPPP